VVLVVVMCSSVGYKSVVLWVTCVADDGRYCYVLLRGARCNTVCVCASLLSAQESYNISLYIGLHGQPQPTDAGW